MLPSKHLQGFAFEIRLSYVGTHLCGRETETEDTGVFAVRMLNCPACGLPFPATNVRMYVEFSGSKQPDLIKELTLEEYDREHPPN